MEEHLTNGHSEGQVSSNEAQDKKTPKLLVLSASDEKALKRVIDQYKPFYKTHISTHAEKLDRLAFTLAARRSHMLWRTFSISSDDEETLEVAKPIRSSAEAACAFVFTGQGAQYVDMGVQLLQYDVFKSYLSQINELYSRLGCTWSIFGKFLALFPLRGLH